MKTSSVNGERHGGVAASIWRKINKQYSMAGGVSWRNAHNARLCASRCARAMALALRVTSRGIINNGVSIWHQHQ